MTLLTDCWMVFDDDGNYYRTYTDVDDANYTANCIDGEVVHQYKEVIVG